MCDRCGEFFLGVLVGAVAGAVAALLLAPAPGEQMRKQIGEKGIELKGQAQKLADDARAQAQQQAEYIQEQGRIVLAETAKKAQQAVQDAQAKLNKPDEASA